MVGTACSMGTIVNGFIVVMNFIEWIKSKKLTTCDAILITLGLSRSFFQCYEPLEMALCYSVSLENLSELVIWRIDRENWISGFGIGFTPSFFMFIISAVLLISSLWRYNRLMQEVSSSYRNASAESWISVIKALLSFILYAFNVIALFLLLSNISSLEAPSSVPVQLDCHLCLYTKHDLDSGVETAGRCV
ncbi:taste receptor type 2 member 40-like [Gopherus evgoodei]|uniref:taste receptor type 2 member 40-like n=1 Tax=Gopherus evgoodei TaxID=1825980 RepID=UPI0011CF3230|nr:taste receptor type 2 member 40-like [Gopherus evgoodei]